MPPGAGMPRRQAREDGVHLVPEDVVEGGDERVARRPVALGQVGDDPLLGRKTVAGTDQGGVGQGLDPLVGAQPDG